MFKYIIVLAGAFMAGVLTAPKSGSETRKDIKTNLDKKIKDVSSNIKERMKK